MSAKRRMAPAALPGFGLSMGFTLSYLTLIVLVPLSALFFKSASLGWSYFWRAATSMRVLASYRLTITASLAAAALNTASGLLVAWVLARYDFPGKRMMDALVDLPLALPTAVAGIALTSLYSENGWIGRHLQPHGIRIAYHPAGIVLALAFVSFPFVVRSVQPVLEDFDQGLEEAAASLGAGRWQVFYRVVLPSILPALLTGAALAFGRALGEYGSVIFIAGNVPMKTEISALLIVAKLEQYDYVGATSIAAVLLTASFLLLLGINLLQARIRRQETEA